MEYVLFPTICNKKNQALGSTAVAQCKRHWGMCPSPLLQDQNKEIKQLQTTPSSHLKSCSTNSLCPKTVQLGWPHIIMIQQGKLGCQRGSGSPCSPCGLTTRKGLDPAGCRALCTRCQHPQVTYPRKEPCDRVLRLLTHFVGFSAASANWISKK